MHGSYWGISGLVRLGSVWDATGLVARGISSFTRAERHGPRQAGPLSVSLKRRGKSTTKKLSHGTRYTPS